MNASRHAACAMNDSVIGTEGEAAARLSGNRCRSTVIRPLADDPVACDGGKAMVSRGAA